MFSRFLLAFYANFCSWFKRTHHIEGALQFTAFFSWLGSQSFSSSICVGVETHDSFEYFDAHGNMCEAHTPSHIVCDAGNFTDSLLRVGIQENTSWHRIFASPIFEIWEDKDVHGKDTLPLRFGLCDEEKRALLLYVRTLLSNFLCVEDNETPDSVDVHTMSTLRLHEHTHANVSLWVRGDIRGSGTSGPLPLTETLAHATDRAMHDYRFKPLTADDLHETTIEITLWNGLHIPLTHAELTHGASYPEKGYHIETQHSSYTHLPLTLNADGTAMSHGFLRILLTRAGIHNQREVRTISIFEVIDFVETTTQIHPLTLDGPMPRITECASRDLLETFRNVGDNGASFLIKFQEKDGNFPLSIDPKTGAVLGEDWARAPFALWSLACYGNAVKRADCIESAMQGLHYYRKHLFTHPALPDAVRTIGLMYLAYTESELNPREDLSPYIHRVLSLIPSLQFSPILWGQIARFSLVFASHNTALLDIADTHTNQLFEAFMSERDAGRPIPLAHYPELMYILKELGVRRENTLHSVRAREVTHWYLSQMLPSGAFPYRSGGQLAGPRGGGKVFEVLTECTEYTKEDSLRTLAWLMSMQYGETTDYFIPLHIRERVRGGFRHDFLNQSVWIDANAHVLVGIARAYLKHIR